MTVKVDIKRQEIYITVALWPIVLSDPFSIPIDSPASRLYGYEASLERETQYSSLNRADLLHQEQ